MNAFLGALAPHVPLAGAVVARAERDDPGTLGIAPYTLVSATPRLLLLGICERHGAAVVLGRSIAPQLHIWHPIPVPFP